MDYFKRLQALLEQERTEDRQSYIRLMQSTSAAERRANGLTWYPVAIRGTEVSRGDYLTVELERTTHKDINHQLRFGASAVLFSNHDPETDRVEGTIAWQGGDRLKLTLRTEELPDWAENGKLGVDLLFDEYSYEESLYAMKLAEKLAEKKEEGRLIRILTGSEKPGFRRPEAVTSLPALNESQNEALNKILLAEHLAIVHGPPGTGKTTTLVAAIKELVRQEPQQVLVTAPSNTAVDLLSEKLSEAGLNVLRVGNPVKVSERLQSLTLDSRMADHPDMKEIKRLKKQAAEYKNLAHKYKRNFGKAEREQRKALFDEAHKVMKDVDRMEQYIIDDLTGKAQIITATLVGSHHYTVRQLRYDTVVIDEAGQALEPAAWIPILKGRKLIMAGDHLQLPPTIKSNEAANAGLAETLLEKNVSLHPEAVVMLREQYRMHRAIMGFPSETFYDANLQAHTSVAGHLIAPDEPPLQFIDTAGCGFDEIQEQTAISNPEEAGFLIRFLTNLVTKIETSHAGQPFPSIAVIAPYKQQIHELFERFEHSPELQRYREHISVNTIDSFQGQERDIVFISMTRSNADGIIGFLADTRRMNVAMTRARKKLVVVGDSATISRHPFYADFIKYAEDHDAYQSAWEFME